MRADLILICVVGLLLILVPFVRTKTYATFLSALFHPLLMPTYGCLLMFFGIKDTIFDYMTAFDAKWRITLVVFLFSFAFPALNIVILYKLKRIPSITLSNSSDRTFPYIMTSIFYFGLFYLLKDASIWATVKLFVLGGGIAILFTSLINIKYKISAHMVGIGGLFGALLAISYLVKFDMTLFYILAIIVAGLVGTARLFLHEHRPSQIYSGFFLGTVVQIALFIIYEKTILM